MKFSRVYLGEVPKLFRKPAPFMSGDRSVQKSSQVYAARVAANYSCHTGTMMPTSSYCLHQDHPCDFRISMRIKTVSRRPRQEIQTIWRKASLRPWIPPLLAPAPMYKPPAPAKNELHACHGFLTVMLGSSNNICMHVQNPSSRLQLH